RCVGCVRGLGADEKYLVGRSLPQPRQHSCPGYPDYAASARALHFFAGGPVTTSGLKALICGAMLCAIAIAAHAQTTLYERMGGEAKLRAAMNEFVSIIVADERINFAFADTDLRKFNQLLFE